MATPPNNSGKSPKAPALPAPAHDRSAARDTATFTPYYWEAYNEIVEPRRFDHYLIRKWLPDLGGDGLAVLKVLRDRCYHNPTSGVLRNEVEIDLLELAAACNISERTLRRIFESSAALGQFVQAIKQFNVVGGQARRRANAYRVCMDDPIHPDDMELYDTLRAAREIERMPVPNTRTFRPKAPERPGSEKEKFTGQNGRQTNSGAEFTGQNDRADTTYLSGQDDRTLTGQNDRAIVNLPFGDSLTKESLTPLADSPHKSPQGEGETDSPTPVFDPLQSAWNVALKLLAQVVNTPTLNAHLKPMRLVSVEGDRAVLAAPTAFARNWIEGRHRAEVEAALSEALGKPVTVQITAGGK